jgi:hypothetical protein
VADESISLDDVMAHHRSAPTSTVEAAILDQKVASVRHLAEHAGLELTPDVLRAAMFGTMIHQFELVQQGLDVDAASTPLRAVSEIGWSQWALSMLAAEPGQ